MRQAIVLAAICEFLGAVLVGAKVAGTIKNGIISLKVFQDNAGVEMLAFTCALVASATWLMIATKKSWPVSTTYSIVSALAGVGVALDGPSAVQWGWNNGKGLATIFAGFGIAPAISAGFGAIVYLITKYAVLERKNSVKAGLMISPFYFFTVVAVLTMSIVYKGSPSLKLDKLPKTTIALAIVLTALVVAILSMIFWLPYVYCKVVRKDSSIRFYHFFFGPLLWKRPVPAQDDTKAHVVDYRVHGRDDGHVAGTDVFAETAAAAPSPVQTKGSDIEAEADLEGKEHRTEPSSPTLRPTAEVPLAELEDDSRKIIGAWYLPRNLWVLVRYQIPKVILYGSSIDIHKAQMGNAKESDRIHEMHTRAQQYDNETEHLYSFLQVLTACTNSFAHGSNDTANAVGPFAAIYYIWSTSSVTPANTPTPTWILAFGAAMLVIGLATYGYKIMVSLGNRLTMHSPSRGFSMELGSAITVLLASQYGIPVSTTMCITGATAGVGLVSGGPKAINWRAFGYIVLGWVLTVPVAGTAAGCLMGMLLNAPHW